MKATAYLSVTLFVFLALTGSACAQVSTSRSPSDVQAGFRFFDQLSREGAYVIGADGEMLGKIARSGTNALGDPYGMGSPYRANGLFSTSSKYGSKYAAQSAFNPYAVHPPKIVYERGNDLCEAGLLTTNQFAVTRGVHVDPRMLQAWLRDRS